MYGLFRTARRLREIGLIGIGERNANYVLRYNQRKFYPRVDDKLITKQLALKAGLPVPELYAVVRDVMVRASVLSAGYKFKVLSLDQRGAQFLVMLDMAPEYAGTPEQGAELEGLITDTAKARHDILVTAVYWRMNMLLGQPPTVRSAGTSATSHSLYGDLGSRPAPLMRPPASGGAPSRPAPLAGAAPTPVAASAPTAAPARTAPAPTGRFDPIEPDEVAAFKQALANAAAARPAPAPAAPGRITRSGPLLPPNTGFEDTVMPQQNERKADLSSTQYGDL